jgi:hypothetical protein
MTLIIKILAVALLHLAFFASYPETGPYGNYYLAVSFLVWSVFILFLNTSTMLIRFISGTAGKIINLAGFALMAVAVAATMPQNDRTSVLEKLRGGKYPDRGTINHGLRRFGIKLDKEISSTVKSLDREADKALTELKEN